MKRILFFFFELLLLSTTLSSGLEEDNDVERWQLKEKWMVRVTMKKGRPYEKSMYSKVKTLSKEIPKAYNETLCGGVIVGSNLIYVPGTFVDKFKAEDLLVVMQVSNKTYDVKKIKLSQEIQGISRHGILVLEISMSDYETIDVMGKSKVALKGRCYVSELWVHSTLGNPLSPRIPRNGAFGVFSPNSCAPHERFGDAAHKRSGKPPFVYASPVVCQSELHGDTFALIGNTVWSFEKVKKLRTNSACYLDALELKEFIDREISTETPVEPITVKPTNNETNNNHEISTEKPVKPITLIIK